MLIFLASAAREVCPRGHPMTAVVAAAGVVPAP